MNLQSNSPEIGILLKVEKLQVEPPKAETNTNRTHYVYILGVVAVSKPSPVTAFSNCFH